MATRRSRVAAAFCGVILLITPWPCAAAEKSAAAAIAKGKVLVDQCEFAAAADSGPSGGHPTRPEVCRSLPQPGRCVQRDRRIRPSDQGLYRSHSAQSERRRSLPGTRRFP